MAQKTYKTFISPDGKHTQKVGSRVREVELRHAGWREQKPTTTKTTAPAETPKENRK